MTSNAAAASGSKLVIHSMVPIPRIPLESDPDQTDPEPRMDVSSLIVRLLRGQPEHALCTALAKAGFEFLERKEGGDRETLNDHSAEYKSKIVLVTDCVHVILVTILALLKESSCASTSVSAYAEGKSENDDRTLIPNASALPPLRIVLVHSELIENHLKSSSQAKAGSHELDWKPVQLPGYRPLEVALLEDFRQLENTITLSLHIISLMWWTKVAPRPELEHRLNCLAQLIGGEQAAATIYPPFAWTQFFENKKKVYDRFKTTAGMIRTRWMLLDPENTTGDYQAACDLATNLKDESWLQRTFGSSWADATKFILKCE